MSKTTEELAKEAEMSYALLKNQYGGAVAPQQLEKFHQLCIAEERSRLLDVAREPVGKLCKDGVTITWNWLDGKLDVGDKVYSAPLNATAMRLLGQRDGLEKAAQVIEAQDVDPAFKNRMADAIRALINKENENG